MLKVFLLGISLHTCPKDVYPGYFAYTSILKMCILGIDPHIYAVDQPTGYFQAYLS